MRVLVEFRDAEIPLVSGEAGPGTDIEATATTKAEITAALGIPYVRGERGR